MNQETPALRGMVVTSVLEGTQICAYVNITFVVPNVEASNVDLAQAFSHIASLIREGKVKERPVALRREFIQPV